MPKLNRPPKYCRDGKYAAVYLHGKKYRIGLHGSPESQIAYARLLAESKINPAFCPHKGKADTTVKEVAAAFLDHAERTLGKPNYTHYRIVVVDFLLKFYGDGTLVNDFKPSCLKLVRQEMIQSSRFCRKQINEYTRRIITLFTWAAEMEYANANTALALKTVKRLSEGYPGTFENPEREHVADEIIRRTLPFLPQTIQAMVRLQRLTGMRPSEVFNMRVGQIDRNADSGLWLYRIPHHKTEKKVKWKKIVPLGLPEQKLIAPYLEGKEPAASVFSPRTAMRERTGTDRSMSQYGEFYNKDSYRTAVTRAIENANRQLSNDEQIPHWTPYQLRHSASSAMEVEVGFDESQALLDHISANTTARYNHRRLEKLKKLAKSRRDPFDDEQSET